VNGEWRQTVVVVAGVAVVCALLVWWLEATFIRQRLRVEWTEFLEQLPTREQQP